jgi:tetratricopeptide (TPR) repeat protein/transcriptional regulator with XRE-family HTH domain
VVDLFGGIVRAQRLRLGLSQQDLADRAGMSARSIGRIEAGRTATPRPATVRLLADALGLTGAAREDFYRSIAAAADGGGPATQGLVPAQLPLRLSTFVGRAEQLAYLDSLLPAGAPPSPVICALHGTAGIGKTSLAVVWSHRVRDRFPDGQLYVNLRGFEPDGGATAPAAAIRGFLIALGVAPQQIPPEPDARAALYRSVVADRRLLILLDNARDAGQVRPLLPGAGAAMVIVTSRDRLTGLVAVDGAHPIALDLLSHAESYSLLAARLGAVRIEADPEATDRIIERCARLPLALAVAAAQLRQTGAPVATLAADLADAGDRLDVLDGGEPASEPRAVFSWSYSTLSAGAARLFRLLGLHPGRDVSVAAAASLAGLSGGVVRPLLSELDRVSLVVEQPPGRFSCHDLLRVYAAELAGAHETSASRQQAVGRLLDHYLHSAYEADRLLTPARDRTELSPAADGVTPENLTDGEQASHWFEVEHDVLLLVARHACDNGWDYRCVNLSFALQHHLDWRGDWHDAIGLGEQAARSARRFEDHETQARAHRLLAHSLMRLGHHGGATRELSEALDVCRRAGDVRGQAHAHRGIALVWGAQNRYAEALVEDQRALDLYQSIGYAGGEAYALNAVGWDLAQLGEYDRALAYCERAVPLNVKINSPVGEAHAWDSLGYIHHRLDRLDEAVACYEQAIEIFRSLGDRGEEAITLDRLGDAHTSRGDPGSARDCWSRAMRLYRLLDRPEADAVQARLLGLDG